MTNELTRERIEKALGVLKSDGYHTFYELYEHRTALFAALCNTYNDRSWKSFKHADGTMVFKWSEVQIRLSEIRDLFPSEPICGNRVPKNSGTHWLVFFKPTEVEE